MRKALLSGAPPGHKENSSVHRKAKIPKESSGGRPIAQISQHKKQAYTNEGN
jgi:hypothetical protein